MSCIVQNRFHMDDFKAQMEFNNIAKYVNFRSKL